MEKSDLIELIFEHEINNDDEKNIRNHRKRRNPQRRSIAHTEWSCCSTVEVDILPHDIDGICKYRLRFDRSERMKSTKDGRNRKTWVSSSRRGHDGIRRVATCDGCYECTNEHCKFQETYKKANVFHFRTKPMFVEYVVDVERKSKMCINA